MRKMNWLVGIVGAWSAGLGCTERTLPLGQGPAEGGESTQAGHGGIAAQGGSLQGGANAKGGTPSAGGSAESGQAGMSPEEGGTGAIISGGTGTIVSGGTGGTGSGETHNGGTHSGGEGQAGECNDEQGPPITFSGCSRPTFTMGASTCGLADTRLQLACGEPGSIHDASCCPRETCRDDSQCGADATCIPRLVQTLRLGGSGVEECLVNCGKCACSVYDNLDLAGYCVGRDEGFARFDCDVSELSCDDLALWRSELKGLDLLSSDDQTATGITSYAARTIACEDQLDLELTTRCGALPKCDCSGQDCTIALSDFHGLGLGNSHTGYNMKAVRAACPAPEYGYGHYSECDDDSVRYEVIEGGENKYLFVFPRGSNELSYGHADGYVAGLCGLPDVDISVISTGPTPPSSGCRTCKFCPSDWDSVGAGLPDCVFDQSGNISLPAP